MFRFIYVIMMNVFRAPPYDSKNAVYGTASGKIFRRSSVIQMVTHMILI